jgi:hypothetical protein
MVNPKDFAILPWDFPSGDLEMYRQIRACGFNLAGFVPPEQLDLVQEAGLKALVFDRSIHAGNAEAVLEDAEILSRVKAVVKRVDKHPAAFGYYLRDEPGASIFPGLGKWAQACKIADPKALAYINLFPNYASPAQLETETYQEYLEAYIEQVKPSYISYDHYAMMEDGSLRNGYFQNLEAVRAAARRYALPFWNIVLSNAHFHYADPSLATLRFQLYTTLAYGARGISYFTYFSPRIGNFRLAPIDQFGNPTPTWDMLRNTNLQLNALAPTYIQLVHTHVFHYPQVPEGCTGLESSRLLSHLECSGSLSSDDPLSSDGTLSSSGLVVGEFDGPEGRPYVLVVNKDLHHSTSFNLTFKTPGTIQLVSAYTGAEEPFSGEQPWLAPGQGMLLGLTPID